MRPSVRNIRRHEHALEGAIAGICRALRAVERTLGAELSDEGGMRVTFDDSIITDTTAEKRQDMDEVSAELMQGWEYRTKWYGEDEAMARRRGDAARSAVGDGGPEHDDAAQAGVPGRGHRRDERPPKAWERQRPDPWG